MSDENLPAVSPSQGDDFFTQMGNELTPVSEEEQKAIQEFAGEGMKQEAQGLPIDFPRIKILHAGANMFSFVDEDRTVKEFVGIIIAIAPQRVWWPYEFGKGPDDDDGRPHCFTSDLIKPDPESKSPQSDTCANCPMDQYDSAIKGRGKACNETRRVFLIPEERMLPHWMIVPPSSLKPMRRYINEIVNKKLGRPQLITTKFSIVSASNRDGVDYSELKIEPGVKLSDAMVHQVMKFKKDIDALLTRAAPMTEKEYAGSQGA